MRPTVVVQAAANGTVGDKGESTEERSAARRQQPRPEDTDRSLLLCRFLRKAYRYWVCLRVRKGAVSKQAKGVKFKVDCPVQYVLYVR